jgi:multidrug efflux pump subunit AcrA (membrane-fusion protein)
MKHFIVRNSKYFGAVAVIIIVGGIVWYIFSSTKPTLGLYTVSRGNVISSVDIQGTVSSSNSVSLSFQESGQIAKVYVNEGDNVVAGQPLVSLDDSTEQTALRQEQAALAAAQAQLDKIQGGARPEELAIYKQKYNDSTTALTVAMNNAYLAVQDAIVNKTDKLFTNGNTANPVLSVPDQSQNDLYAVNAERLSVGTVLTNWKNILSNTDSSTSSIAIARTTTTNSIVTAEAFINHLSTIVGNLSAGNSGMTQDQINTDTTLVTAVNQEVTGAANTETTVDAAWSAARDSLAL